MDPLSHLSEDILLLTGYELREFARELCEELQPKGFDAEDIAEALMNTARRVA